MTYEKCLLLLQGEHFCRDLALLSQRQGDPGRQREPQDVRSRRRADPDGAQDAVANPDGGPGVPSPLVGLTQALSR